MPELQTHCPRCGLKFGEPIQEVPTINFESAPKDDGKTYVVLCWACGTLGHDGLLKFLRQVASGQISPEDAVRAVKAQVRLREESIRKEYEACATAK